MKKLMFTAAVAAAGLAFGIESANTVGYTQTATPAGFIFYAPQFKNPDGSAINIQQIKLDAETATSWADNIQILEEVSGAVIASYVYATTDESGLEEAGWLNEELTDLANVTIKNGASVAIETTGESTLTSAGEVTVGGTPFEAEAGFVFLGNNTPVSVNIQDIKLEDGKATSWVDNIQLIEAGSGAVYTSYVYATPEESGLEEAGWLNEELTDLADVTLAPGEGFALELGQDCTVTLPSAL